MGRRLVGSSLAGALTTLIFLSALGCGRSRPAIPNTRTVVGTVTCEGVPVRGGTISFWPDKERGNNSPYQPMSGIDTQGHYRLEISGEGGAVLGWYKVVVFAPEMRISERGTPQPTGKQLVPTRYGDVRTTDLRVEVVANAPPGAYDLKLAR
jgi:hypothetical protein